MIARGIEIADLGDRIDSKVDTYSKGMMRRLLIARAIMPNPKLAILDEVTSGLDVVNAYEIREIIRDCEERCFHNNIVAQHVRGGIALQQGRDDQQRQDRPRRHA